MSNRINYINCKKLVVKLSGNKPYKWMVSAPTFIEIRELLSQLEDIEVANSRWPRKPHIVIRLSPDSPVSNDVIIKRITDLLSDHYPTLSHMEFN